MTHNHPPVGDSARVARGPTVIPPPYLHDAITAPLNAEAEVRVAEAALSLLSDPGIEIQNSDACLMFARAGAKVDGHMVRLAPDMVRALVAQAPASFSITPRNPARGITPGGGQVHFGAVGSATHVWDIARGKCLGDRASFQDFLRLSQHFDCIHYLGGYPVEPADIPAPLRHLESLGDMLRLTDKPLNAYPIDPGLAEDTMELVRLAAGLSPSEFEARPRLYSNVNSLSPLRYEGPVIGAAMRYAAMGQAVMVTPYPVAGVSAPSGVAGIVVVALAEALAALALMQLVRPGTPVMLGALTPPSFAGSHGQVHGGPHSMRATQMLGQMARYFGVPFRATGGCSAPIPDGQAMWEAVFSLQAGLQSGAAMISHAAGWLEGGLTASPEKFLMDCEMLEEITRYANPALCDTRPEALALDAIRAAGPGGSFFTLGNMRDGGPLSEMRAYEAWHQDGAQWTSQRAHRLARICLDEATDPPMADNAQETFEHYLADRLQAAGA